MLFNKKNLLSASILAVALFMGACSDDDSGTPAPEKGSYVIAVRVPGSNNESTDYLLQTKDLMSGTISAKGVGIEQPGFRTYTKVGSQIVSIGAGALDQRNAMTYTFNSEGVLAEKGKFTFDDVFDVFTTVDNNTIAGIAISRDAKVTTSQYFNANLASSAITGKVSTNLNPLFHKGADVWQSGVALRDGKIFVPYYLQDKSTYATPYTDTAYVAIYSYPAFALEKVIKDTRTGPAGAFNTNSGIIKTENGDLYTFSTTSYTFTQSTKPSAFLRIKNGETTFDQSYFFDIEAATKAAGGFKMHNHYYLGNGLVLAEISTIEKQASAWSYDKLKLAIVDLNNKTIKDVTGTPVHSGLGGNAVQYLTENGKIYYPLKNDAGELYIYQIDAATATAVKGAKIEGSSAPGVFKL
jgi:hypothetical protein